MPETCYRDERGRQARTARRLGQGLCAGAAAFLLLHAAALPALAQDRLVRRFAGEQGLTVPPVSALAQDSTGFLWIGTQGGLHPTTASSSAPGRRS